MNGRTDQFADPQAVARYAEGPSGIVPGFSHLQRMAALLLAERVPQNGRVLVWVPAAGSNSRSSPKRTRIGASMALIRPTKC